MRIISRIQSIGILVGAFLAQLTTGDTLADVGSEASLIIVGGPVWTANDQQPWAEAVAISDDRILDVGDRESIEQLKGPSTKTVDAEGGLVLPGLIDSHLHLFDGGANLQSVQLRSANSREAFVQRLREYAAQLPPGQWITGGDWDHTVWGGELPTRDWIDEATPQNPVWIQRLDGHMALANSLALRRARVNNDVVAPAGGSIERDGTGRITGILRDNAMNLVSHAVPPETSTQLLASLDAATDYLLSHGVTTVCHMGTLTHVRALQAARDSGRLRLRVYASTPLERWEELRAHIVDHGPGDHWLWIGGLKGFVDGSLGSHTAAMLNSFSDRSGDRGLLVNSRDDLFAWTLAADRAGLQVSVHAIGDRAIRLQLDVFAEVARLNGPRDRRFRIEHAQHIHPDDLGRFRRIGVIPSMQPYHAIDDGRWAEDVIGKERSVTTYAFRSLLDDGNRLAFGSDWFVAPASVAWGLYAATTRRTLDNLHPGGWVPDQKIRLEEALRAYTIDAAYAARCEKQLGSIEQGKLADIVIFDRNLFDIETTQINDAAIRYTVVGGVVGYTQQP